MKTISSVFDKVKLAFNKMKIPNSIKMIATVEIRILQAIFFSILEDKIKFCKLYLAYYVL